MSGLSWSATVERFNPATDGLLVKAKGRITMAVADDIKRQVESAMPGIRLLLFDDGCEVVFIRRTRRKTLVKAARRR